MRVTDFSVRSARSRFRFWMNWYDDTFSRNAWKSVPLIEPYACWPIPVIIVPIGRITTKMTKKMQRIAEMDFGIFLISILYNGRVTYARMKADINGIKKGLIIK